MQNRMVDMFGLELSCLDLPPIRDDEWVHAQFGHD
jgi:hypothetical protein